MIRELYMCFWLCHPQRVVPCLRLQEHGPASEPAVPGSHRPGFVVGWSHCYNAFGGVYGLESSEKLWGCICRGCILIQSSANIYSKQIIANMYMTVSKKNQAYWRHSQAFVKQLKLVGPRSFSMFFLDVSINFIIVMIKMWRLRYLLCRAPFLPFSPTSIGSARWFNRSCATSPCPQLAAMCKGLRSIELMKLQPQATRSPWPTKESGISINLQWNGKTAWRNEVWLPNKTSK